MEDGRMTGYSAPRFSPGRILMTAGIAELFGDRMEVIVDLLLRHLTGDWGGLCAEDRALNERALATGSRLLSSYMVSEQVKVWIITEADRGTTTVLLASEY
jgi:hypothetical protein